MKIGRVAALAGATAFALALSGCAGGASSGREKLELWFWGAPPSHRQALEANLVDAYNSSQDTYELEVTFNERVDSNVQTALAAGEGPDIVYGSGPSFVAPFARNGNLVNLDEYSEKYGWKERILPPIYESGTVDGSLYALANSINTVGIFYNRAVLDELGEEVPTTIDELEGVLAAADEAGLYPSIAGNKGWQAINDNYSSMFLTAVAGPQAMYDVLTGTTEWTGSPYEEAVQLSADWYQNGYLGGGEYLNVNFAEAMQLLADGQTPFFFAPTLAFQFATDFFNDAAGNVEHLGFIPFPTIGADLAEPLYTLGTTASFSINANSEHPDAAAEVIDMMMTQDFMEKMTASWPGYWGTPLAGVTLDPSSFHGLSAEYAAAIDDALKAFDDGRFGYYGATFYPPQTQQALIDIESVWLGETTTDEFLTGIQSTFAGELAAGDVPPIPQP